MTRYVEERRGIFGVEPICRVLGVAVSTFYARRSRKPSRRELVGKIPFGGGLIPKAAVAFAGTYVVGLSLERYYRIGYGLTREERRREYESALAHGRTVAEVLLAGLKKVDAA